MSSDFNFETPERVALGALGEPGNRVFIIQIGQGREHLTLKLEKTQVAGLVKSIAMILGEIDRLGHLPKANPVIPPLEPRFAVGEIEVAHLSYSNEVRIELVEFGDPDTEPSRVSLQISKELAGTLAIQGTELIEAGRPTCPLCGFAIEPEGHPCPRTNGYRAPMP